ncbi:MAG: tRNA pseudouridine(38-40) synthase TruA [Bacteriovoracaceae bacterium]|nr:tRNA pseudouridine(38-40) synthase TruA [Bacteriovoracaceae bacterium]
MYSYKLVINYNGANYYGWQTQNNSPSQTIQQELNTALAKIAKSDQIRTLGSGRTDAGVHAIAQVAKAVLPIDIAPEGLCAGLNSTLPRDIRVSSVSYCSHDFHPTFHAKSKRYDYYFAKTVDPFDREQVSRFRFDTDHQKMIDACQLFIGQHDFKDFYCTGTPIKSTIRTIFSCTLSIKKVDTISGAKEYYCFSVSGSGFMKQMVRLMVGTLWNIGRGKVGPAQLIQSLEGKGSGKLGAVAPPCGLYLMEVIY